MPEGPSLEIELLPQQDRQNGCPACYYGKMIEKGIRLAESEGLPIDGVTTQFAAIVMGLMAYAAGVGEASQPLQLACREHQNQPAQTVKTLCIANKQDFATVMHATGGVTPAEAADA